MPEHLRCGRWRHPAAAAAADCARSAPWRFLQTVKVTSRYAVHFTSLIPGRRALVTVHGLPHRKRTSNGSTAGDARLKPAAAAPYLLHLTSAG